MAPHLNPHAQPYYLQLYHVQSSINFYSLPPPLLAFQNSTFCFHQYPFTQFPVKLLPNNYYFNHVPHRLPFNHGPSISGISMDVSANETNQVMSNKVHEESLGTTVVKLNDINNRCVKGRKYPSASASASGGDEFQVKDLDDAVRRNLTTVMIKNIPNKLDKKCILKLLDDHCLAENKKLLADGDNGLAFSEYNFLYLPIDFKTGCNYGFAFVNVNTPTAAYRLYQEFHEKSWAYLGSGKICEVKYARIQGLKQLVGHFSNSFFACETREYLPVHFTPNRNGFPVFTNQRYIGKHIQKQK